MITNRDDDYLICKEYQSRIDQTSSEFPGFITFKHPNGNHYFAWVHEGEIVLRSEAYPDEERMIRGIKAIQKNWDLVERYSVDVAHGVHFLVLWGGGDHQAHTGNMGSHNEIGRSCPKKTRAELHNLLLGKGEDFAQKVIPLSADDIAAPIAAAASIVADDITPDVEEVSHSVSEAVEEIKEEVKIDDTPKEDKTIAAATALAGAALTANSASSEKVIEKVTETANNFSSKTTERVTSAAATAATTIATDDNETGGGFKWWYLLPLLLLPLIWKMCNKEASPDAAATSEVVAPLEAPAASTDTTTATPTAATPTATPAAAPDCNLNWILFDFDKYAITSSAQGELKTMADILKGNPEYQGDLSAHTDAKGSNEYNDQLSKNRAEAAKSALVAMGIDASRLTTSASSEGTPIATNTDDDTGRKFNRRVELRVKDKSGKEICKSIPPDVPSTLKQ
jgi:outer membrane protein OmpA-like peptidoglycan-associated protein/uncharacterized protein YegP (UPF0339 family)